MSSRLQQKDAAVNVLHTQMETMKAQLSESHSELQRVKSENTILLTKSQYASRLDALTLIIIIIIIRHTFVTRTVSANILNLRRNAFYIAFWVTVTSNGSPSNGSPYAMELLSYLLMLWNHLSVCLSVRPSVRNIGVLWSNSWMDQDATW